MQRGFVLRLPRRLLPVQNRLGMSRIKMTIHSNAMKLTFVPLSTVVGDRGMDMDFRSRRRRSTDVVSIFLCDVSSARPVLSNRLALLIFCCPSVRSNSSSTSRRLALTFGKNALTSLISLSSRRSNSFTSVTPISLPHTKLDTSFRTDSDRPKLRNHSFTSFEDVIELIPLTSVVSSLLATNCIQSL